MLSFFLSPPTVWVDKFIESLAVHPKLNNPAVESVNVYGKELLGRERDRFILAFNNVNFLYENGIVPALNKNPIMVKVKQRRRTYEFKMYLYGNGMVEIIRYKRNKRIPYRVSSHVLQEILELRMKDQWWIEF